MLFRSLFSHFGPHGRPSEVLRRQLVQYPAWSDIVARKLAAMGEDALVEELYAMSCGAPQHTDPDFLRRRIRNSVSGLAAYHGRMERAARVG